MRLFKFFKVFICSFIICFICFSIVDYSKPKEVKAFGEEFAIPLVAGGTVLGPGAVVLLGVVSACGIALCNEDVRDFISDCGTYCYDELSKIKASYDKSLNGIEAELTPSLVEKVIEFAKSKEGTIIMKDFSPSIIGDYYSLPIIPSSTYKKLYTFTLTSNSLCYVYGGDSLISPIDSLQPGSNVIYVTGADGWFMLGWNSPGFDSNVNLYHESQSSLSSYTLRVPLSNVKDLSANSNISDSFTYPDILKNACKSIDEYNDKYKEYTGTNSVCADLSMLGGLSLDSSVDDVCTALEGVLPTYSDDVIGTADIPGISVENDGVKVDNPPDTSAKDETGVLGSILEWLRSLLLDLFNFLEGLLQKLIELLKALLMALFVPSDVFIQENVDILKNQLEPKLPYSQYIQLFNDSYEGNQLKDIIINIYGQDVVIVKVTLFERFRELFNTGVYAVIFFLLAVYNYNNIYKLIRGTDYVSATNTINNATGGTGGSGKGGGD